ncbi:hypothetical protein R3P38DRAFT_1374370 [Favolaschia claudopus]|uniref:SAM domain-containing protein n=1 Tax=Favolaschia claudopus TaxID=2862362 RepID=A0AAW0DUI5_9AGAR
MFGPLWNWITGASADGENSLKTTVGTNGETERSGGGTMLQGSTRTTSITVNAELDYDGDGVGATGGIGEGPRFQTRIVWLDKVDLPRIERMSIAEFCTKYQLDDDVRERLKDEGIMNMISLFYENEDELRNMGFNMGSIAEIKA